MQIEINELKPIGNRRRTRRSDVMILNGLGYTFLSLAAAVCLLPFLLILASSLTDEHTILTEGYRLIPKVWSLESYQLLFRMPGKIIHAYIITITVTVVGTALSLFLMSMTAYVLQRKDFKWRNGIAFYFFFTTLFSGGLVPFYILVNNYLNLQDTIAIQIIPMVMNVFYVIVMKAFISSGIPTEITDSAKIDGAGDFLIYARLIVPLCKPALASVGLLTALAYWNDWYLPLLFVRDEHLIPMQYYLYRTLGNFEALQSALVQSGQVINTADVPVESMKMAMTIVAAGPIMIAYPFIQRYFVQGLTMGAVKG